MKFQDFDKIKRRLEKIYKIRKKWNGAQGPFDILSIKTRELFLIEQQILENLITKNKLKKFLKNIVRIIR